MLQEELKNILRERNKDVADVEIPKIINSVMDIYEKGITTGLDIGKQIAINSVCEYIKAHSYVGISGQLICNFTIEELVKSLGNDKP